MNHCSHNGHSQHARTKEPVLAHQVKREKERNHRPAEIYCDDRARVADHYRDNIFHSEEIHELAGAHLLARQLGNGNVDVTPEQAQQQQAEHVAPAHPHALEYVPQDADLDHDHEQTEQDPEQHEERQR